MDAATFSYVLNLLSQNRPVVIAALCVLVCLLLLRPGPKPVAGEQQRNGGPAAHAPRRRVISLSTDGILLEFRDGRPRVLTEMIQPLHELTSLADIYLITQLPNDSDELEAQALAALTEAGVFGEGRCDARKALFCSTEDGRGAMARQIEPASHLDTSVKVLQYIAPHVAQGAVYINAARSTIVMPPGAKGSVVSVASLSEYVAQLKTQR